MWKTWLHLPVAANATVFDEITLPAVTANSAAAVTGVELPLNIALPVSYRLYCTLGVASANGWAATVIGGKY